MTILQKKRAYNYFFKDKNLREFLYNDFYIELSKNIPINACVKNNEIIDLEFEKKLIYIIIKDIICRNERFQKKNN